MYEEEKRGWRTYKGRLIFIGLIWLFVFVLNQMGELSTSGMFIAGSFASLVGAWLGSQVNELRYQNSSQIFCENGLHFSYHPHAVHHKGKWIMVAVGGVSAGGLEWKKGEGTLIFPTTLLQATATDPPKVLYLRGAPSQCSKDALPQMVQEYFVHGGFGYFKEPYYFTITPVVEDGGDQDFKNAIISLSKTEGEIKDLNMQISEQARIIRNFMNLHAEVRDFLRPKWYKRLLGKSDEKQEEA